MIVELKALILGVLEGLTEFLPVSSTGHLLLGMSALGVDPEIPSWQVFLFFIQIGAVLAVFAAMGRNILRLWRRHIVKLVVALLPAVVVGVPLDKVVEAHLQGPTSIAIAFMLGGIVMIFVERRFRDPAGTRIEDVTMRQAVVIGLAQCVSIIPGTSRALATILGGMIAGLSPAAAVEFSFYLAIPTILGATVLKLHHHASALTSSDLSVMAVGFVAALMVALLVVRWFLGYMARGRMTLFAVYRLAAGAAILVVALARGGSGR